MSRDFRAGLIAGLVLGICAAFFVIVPAIGTLAKARAQISLTVFGASKHSESGYCEINPGIGVNYQLTPDLRIGHGRFLNSKCRWSNGTGLAYTPLHAGRWRFGFALMRLTGYRETATVAPLPIGAYLIDKRQAIDFFVVHKGEESVAGAAWRFSF
jgi:hypothetical protein